MMAQVAAVELHRLLEKEQLSTFKDVSGQGMRKPHTRRPGYGSD